jgi:hypothetical protein
MSRALISLPLALLLAAPPAATQATNDESRLLVGIMGGWIGGSQLWSVRQPVFTNGGNIDEFVLVRDLRANITVAGQLTYFPNPTFGWTGEITYVGLGNRDGCALAVDNGDVFNRTACDAIAGRNRAASAVTASGGVVLRSGSRGDVQPYLRANVGVALVPRSTTTMSAFFGNDGELVLVIYGEDDSRAARPLGALSVGFSTAPRAGYQFRLEARATAVQLDVVTGPSPVGSPDPPIATRWTFLPSIMVGLDIVLEKRRGRRY